MITQNLKGTFEFGTPFESAIPSNIEMCVTTTSTLADLERDGKNPLQTIYILSGLTEENYKEDLKNNVPIIGLESNGKFIYVPDKYILKYPDPSGTPYTAKALVLNMSTIPDSIDLDSILVEIQELIKARTGIKPNKQIVNTSATVYADKVSDEAFNNARSVNITDRSNSFIKIAILNTEVAKLKEENAQLRDCVRTALDKL
jgi:hypothetical protein